MIVQDKKALNQINTSKSFGRDKWNKNDSFKVEKQTHHEATRDVNRAHRSHTFVDLRQCMPRNDLKTELRKVYARVNINERADTIDIWNFKRLIEELNLTVAGNRYNVNANQIQRDFDMCDRDRDQKVSFEDIYKYIYSQLEY
jgi:hypothetical protein